MLDLLHILLPQSLVLLDYLCIPIPTFRGLSPVCLFKPWKPKQAREGSILGPGIRPAAQMLG